MALQKWDFDTVHSSVAFTVRHMLVSKVRGRFNKWSGSLSFDDADPAASHVEVRIEAASVDTLEPQRDAHLRSADFFDVERFPTLTFRSRRVTPVDDETLRIAGDLTMHGVTREVELEAVVQGVETDPWGNERVGFEITGQIRRGDFGMTFNQALGSGNVLVSDKVRLSLDISAIRQAA